MKRILKALVLVVVLAVAISIIVKTDIVSFGSSSMGNGAIKEVGEDFVVIEGFVQEENGETELMTVTFSISPRTTFKKSALIVTHENQVEGGTFTPEVVEGEGSFDDITVGLPVSGVKAKGELVDGGSARATEIHYSKIEIQR